MKKKLPFKAGNVRAHRERAKGASSSVSTGLHEKGKGGIKTSRQGKGVKEKPDSTTPPERGPTSRNGGDLLRMTKRETSHEKVRPDCGRSHK